MITDLIISMFIVLLKAFFGMFPVVTELPWGTDSIVLNAITTFKAFMNLFPPMSIIFTAVSIYIGFKLVLMLWSIVPVFGKMIHRKG